MSSAALDGETAKKEAALKSLAEISIILLNIWLIQLFYNNTFGKKCTIDDFQYEYTKCNDNGERWRVAIPKIDNLECDNGVPLPIRGVNCSFKCDPGMYLDIVTQRCQLCPKGTYSLGDGIRYDIFDEIPSNFEIENINILPERNIDMNNKEATEECPIRKGWIIRNTELIYVPSPCLSRLSYSVNLIHPGYVEYAYRLPRNSRALIFNVDVRNDRCRSYRDEMKQLMGSSLKKASSEDSSDWRRDRIELKAGHNVISWTVMSYRLDAFYNNDVITISHIDVYGLQQVEKCSNCPGGTYSGVGAKQCRFCRAGYYSPPGSTQCIRCPALQYSHARSTFCINRPICSLNDYYPVLKPCINGKTRMTFVKVQPNICRDDLIDAVKIPEAGNEIPCPKCNPGMKLNSIGQCVFCEKDHYSHGEECHRCPIDTLPNYGYHYIIWNTLPPNMFTKCEYIIEGDSMHCAIDNAWIPSGSMIQSSSTQEKGIALELGLIIQHGFSNPLLAFDEPTSSHNPIAHITFDFEMKCSDDSCVLYFIEDAPSQTYYRILADFSGTQHYQSYSYPIVSPNPTKFLFVFIRSRSSTKEDVITDRAFIYRINVTNVGEQSGGASTCLQCPKYNGKCVHCLAGEYITEKTNECKKCPNGLILNTTSDRMGIKSCIPCGPNLISNDSIRCISDGILILENDTINKTYHFNFTYFFNRTFTAEGVKVFAHEGISYFHLYNISLLTENGANCKETYQSSDYDSSSLSYSIQTNQDQDDNGIVNAYICRSTAFPMMHSTANITQRLFYLAPVIIGDKILAITPERELNEHVKLTDREFDIDSNNTNSESPDIHFYFGSSGPSTQLCSHGVYTAVTLKCDPRQTTEPLVKLPSNCPDGTCDGCLYHIIIYSSHACPICTDNDYSIIKGECINGMQSVHSIPASYCISMNMQKKERIEACSTLTLRLQLLIFAIILTVIGLCIIIVMAYRKNKSLEYKYMKLVEWKDNAKDLRSLGAETCGVEDDDDNDDDDDDGEDQDRIFFARKNRRSYREYRKERNLSYKGDREDSGQTPFVPLEQAD
ncbi:Endosome/lysosome-associated apoptosis and autophagy regulator family member [Dirofilaria immitis]